jgi:hypothetical protein
MNSPPETLGVIGIEPFAACVPQPKATAASSYGARSVEIDMAESLCPGFGSECQYRYFLQNLATERVVGDTSAWLELDSGSTSVPVTSSATLGIRAQVRCIQDTGYVKSAWSPIDSVR